jgi:glutamate N-acetyltransferase/amino-acid N-acetyltransferase
VAKQPCPKGFLAAGVAAGMKPDGAPDVALIVSEAPAVAAGATTRNRFASPSVEITRQRLKRGQLRAIVANSKFSNAVTGRRGMRDAETMTALAAECLGLDPLQVATASTGVIGQYLPMERIAAGIREAAAQLSPQGWNDVARALMTTDTRAKDAGRRLRIAGADVSLRGVAKGVGMIHPNMGTMLAFIGADVAIGLAQLRRITRRAVEQTFNAVTVDGDTSTSDTVIVLANGAAGGARLRAGLPEERKFAEALTDLMRELAVELARDGEGASKLIEVTVAGARTETEAREAARKVAASNLVKTAVHGADANWGRIAMALGNAPARFDQSRVAIKILGVPVMRRGIPVDYDEPALQAEMSRRDRIEIAVRLGAGKAQAVAWGSDLTAEYIRINADYRT